MLSYCVQLKREQDSFSEFGDIYIEFGKFYMEFSLTILKPFEPLSSWFSIWIVTRIALRNRSYENLTQKFESTWKQFKVLEHIRFRFGNFESVYWCTINEVGSRAFTNTGQYVTNGWFTGNGFIRCKHIQKIFSSFLYPTNSLN